MSLLDDLPIGVSVGLDTAVFIYQVEQHPIFGPIVSPLFTDRLQKGTNQAVTSTVSVAEVLVQPLAAGRHDLIQVYRDLLTATAWINTAAITNAIAERAAELRGRYRLRLPDALQIAATLEQGAPIFVTNDGKLRKVTDLQVLILTDYQAPAAP